VLTTRYIGYPWQVLQYNPRAPDPAAELRCDAVLDRGHFEHGDQFSDEIFEFFCQFGPDCCERHGDGEDYYEQHIDDGCELGAWLQVEILLRQHADKIERIGFNQDERLIHVVTRELSSESRRAFIKEELPEIAFLLDCIFWRIRVAAYDGASWSGANVFDGLQAFYAKLVAQKKVKLVFGDPESIAVRNAARLERSRVSH
jgi:hypothetical protein